MRVYQCSTIACISVLNDHNMVQYHSDNKKNVLIEEYNQESKRRKKNQRKEEQYRPTFADTNVKDEFIMEYKISYEVYIAGPMVVGKE